MVMKMYHGGESVSQGFYLNLSRGEFVQLREEASVLPEGTREGNRDNYIKLATPLVMLAGPLAGLAFLIFLPFTGIFGIAGLLAYKVGGRLGKTYLTRRNGNHEKGEPASLAEEITAELEREEIR